MPYLQIGYKKIHYADLKPDGNEARETFICVHGLGSSQDYYHAIALGLKAHNFRCIIFDTTGAGRSPYTHIEQSIETLSNDVLGIMDQLEVPKAIVVGHSMGGIVAAHLAAEHNDRILAAVLIGPVYPNLSVAPMFEKRIEIVTREGMEAMANTVPYAAPAKGASPLARSFIRELLLGQDPAGYCSNCRVIINAKPPSYSKISVPILILAGEEDNSAPLAGCKKMFEEMGTTEKKLEIMKGVGHWQCVEAFEEVGKQILAFYHEIQ
ncbi:Alpha/Beta hydrolase protein [Clohesyomyces aquaticus]|uniref:Alpha/Beta hydrolase protein n=1 Tax=Clohesyomyces aquaticus TaxID=1231657 RepID=A0A1Y1ZB77_9PLEO|nr:Alpha/Beta hydrolase protein [Clohesyomyces aquaticus]